MKSDKLIDAIGMIDDEYINEAHETKKKKEFTFSMPSLLKLAAAAVCLVVAITIIPPMFSMGSAKNSYSGGSDSAYYEQSTEYVTSSAYVNDEQMSAGATSSFDVKADQNKKLILTSNMTMETQNIDDVINSINANVEKYGGYIQRSSVYTQGNGTRIYDASIRIPAENYAQFLEDMKAAGNSTSYQESIDDITDSYMDIEARLNSLKAQEEKVLEFYEKAETIEDLMAVEERLSELRYQIEYYESQIKNYDLLVAYSTMNLTVTETKVYTPTSTSFFTRLSNSFVNGWHSFIDSIGDFIIDVAYNIWNIIFLIVLAFVGYRVYRYIRNRRSGK